MRVRVGLYWGYSGVIIRFGGLRFRFFLGPCSIARGLRDASGHGPVPVVPFTHPDRV